MLTPCFGALRRAAIVAALFVASASTRLPSQTAAELYVRANATDRALRAVQRVRVTYDLEIRTHALSGGVMERSRLDVGPDGKVTLHDERIPESEAPKPVVSRASSRHELCIAEEEKLHLVVDKMNGEKEAVYRQGEFSHILTSGGMGPDRESIGLRGKPGIVFFNPQEFTRTSATTLRRMRDAEEKLVKNDNPLALRVEVEDWTIECVVEDAKSGVLSSFSIFAGTGETLLSSEVYGEFSPFLGIPLPGRALISRYTSEGRLYVELEFTNIRYERVTEFPADYFDVPRLEVLLDSP